MKMSTHSVHYAVVALVCVLSDLLLPGRVGLAASAALFLCWSLHLVNRERRSAPLSGAERLSLFTRCRLQQRNRAAEAARPTRPGNRRSDKTQTNATTA